MKYSDLLKQVEELKLNNEKLYKQLNIMFIPVSEKNINENGFDEKRVQYDIDTVYSEYSYKESKVVFFIMKFLNLYLKVLKINKDNFMLNNVYISSNKLFDEMTYYFDSIVASFSVLIEPEQKDLLQKYLSKDEIKKIYPNRKQFGLYWQIYMLRNRILHFTEQRYASDINMCSCYQNFSSKINVVNIDGAGNIHLLSTLLDIYKDNNIEKSINIAIKNREINPFDLLFPNKTAKGHSKNKPFILHISNDIFFDYATSAIHLLKEIENLLNSINQLFFNEFIKYCIDMEQIFNGKTIICMDECEMEYCVKDVFETI